MTCIRIKTYKHLPEPIIVKHDTILTIQVAGSILMSNNAYIHCQMIQKIILHILNPFVTIRIFKI